MSEAAWSSVLGRDVWMYVLRGLDFWEVWGHVCAGEGVGQVLRAFQHPHIPFAFHSSH